MVAVFTPNDFFMVCGLASCPLKVQPEKNYTVLICSCDFDRWPFSSVVLHYRDAEWCFKTTICVNVHAM